MAQAIKFEICDATGEPTLIRIPTVNEVCGTCHGEGKHSAHLGVIDPEEWCDEDMEAYMGGAYDRTCEHCRGQRVVAVPDRAWLEAHPEIEAAYDAHEHDMAELDRMERMERMIGA